MKTPSRVTAYVVDTGPIISLLERNDRDHAWARTTFRDLRAPLITCEAVIAEAWFLAQKRGYAPLLRELVQAILIEVVPAWKPRTLELLTKYEDRTSVADVSLLVLVEKDAGRVVVTLDRDFGVYRIHGRKAVPMLAPWL